MDCKHVEPLLMDFLYHELEAAEQRPLEAHLQSCADCSHDLQELRQTREMFGQLEMVEPSPEITTLLLEEANNALKERTNTFWQRLREYLRPMVLHPAAAGAFTLVLMLGVGFLFYQKDLGGNMADEGALIDPPPAASPAEIASAHRSNEEKDTKEETKAVAKETERFAGAKQQADNDRAPTQQMPATRSGADKNAVARAIADDSLGSLGQVGSSSGRSNDGWNAKGGLAKPGSGSATGTRVRKRSRRSASKRVTYGKRDQNVDVQDPFAEAPAAKSKRGAKKKLLSGYIQSQNKSEGESPKAILNRLARAAKKGLCDEAYGLGDSLIRQRPNDKAVVTRLLKRCTTVIAKRSRSSVRDAQKKFPMLNDVLTGEVERNQAQAKAGKSTPQGYKASPKRAARKRSASKPTPRKAAAAEKSSSDAPSKQAPAKTTAY